MAAWHKDGLRATSANPPPGLLRDREFRKGFAALAPLGLTFDAWLLHTQLSDLIDLAHAFPDTTIICDHIGGPATFGPYAGRRDEVFADWSRSMRELARCPNVNVKLGGMGMHVLGFDFPNRPASSFVGATRRGMEALCRAVPRRIRCRSRHVREQLPGPTRERAVGWCCWNAFKRLASGSSADEKQALFHGNAAGYTVSTLPPKAL